MNTSPAIIEVWRWLARLRHLEFTASTGPGSSTGWSGCGQARIEPRIDNDGIRLFENGTFRPAGASAQIAFRNVYRWQNRESHLSLLHERFGADSPVWLFDLVATDERTLVADTPHHCGRDDYSARLRIVDDGLAFTWTITGPRKNETLRYQYRSADFGGPAYGTGG